LQSEFQITVVFQTRAEETLKFFSLIYSKLQIFDKISSYFVWKFKNNLYICSVLILQASQTK